MADPWTTLGRHGRPFDDIRIVFFGLFFGRFWLLLAGGFRLFFGRLCLVFGQGLAPFGRPWPTNALSGLFGVHLNHKPSLGE